MGGVFGPYFSNPRPCIVRPTVCLCRSVWEIFLLALAGKIRSGVVSRWSLRWLLAGANCPQSFIGKEKIKSAARADHPYPLTWAWTRLACKRTWATNGDSINYFRSVLLCFCFLLLYPVNRSSIKTFFFSLSDEMALGYATHQPVHSCVILLHYVLRINVIQRGHSYVAYQCLFPLVRVFYLHRHRTGSIVRLHRHAFVLCLNWKAIITHKTLCWIRTYCDSSFWWSPAIYHIV